MADTFPGTEEVWQIRIRALELRVADEPLNVEDAQDIALCARELEALKLEAER